MFGRELWWLYQFTRFSAFSFTGMVPLLGAATASTPVGTRQALGLTVVAMTFHVFAYVLNDVIDLPIDRHAAWRQDAPLVTRSIAPRAALAIALAHIPASFALAAALHAPVRALGCLGAAILLLAAYDLWGKRCPAPIVTDIVQALGWAALGLMGVFMAGPPTGATVLLLVHVVAYILMVNGVHGPLRDLGADARAGARTTALALGVRGADDGSPIVTRRFAAYAGSLQVVLALVVILRLPAAAPMDAAGVSARVTALVLLVGSFTLMGAAGCRKYRASTGLIGMLHLVVTLALLPILYGAALPVNARWVLAAVVCVPVATMILVNRDGWRLASNDRAIIRPCEPSER